MAAAKTAEKPAGSAYLEYIKNKEVQLVDITAPSGFVFKFRKPGIFGTLFGIGNLPQTATAGAVDEWVNQGVLKIGDGDGELSEDTAKQLNMGMAIVDRVLHLSHTPKLVSGPARNDNELSTDDVDEADLTFLFKWVSAGGEMGAMLSNFPDGTQASPLASASRPKQRDKAKPTSGDR